MQTTLEKRRAGLEKARIVRRATGRLGGRPKGSLAPATIARINNERAMKEAIQKRAGRIVNNLLLGSDYLDTTASKELLERGFGKVSQDVTLSGEFQIKALHVVALPHAGVPVVEPQIIAPQQSEPQLQSPTGMPSLIEE